MVIKKIIRKKSIELIKENSNLQYQINEMGGVRVCNECFEILDNRDLYQNSQSIQATIQEKLEAKRKLQEKVDRNLNFFGLKINHGHAFSSGLNRSKEAIVAIDDELQQLQAELEEVEETRMSNINTIKDVQGLNEKLTKINLNLDKISDDFNRNSLTAD